MSVADILNKAADLIEPEGAWTQGCTARDADGNEVDADSPRAVCFCAGGAISKVVEFDYDAACPAWDAFEKVVPARFDRWNDAPQRTQAEVVAKLREAAELAQAGQP